MVEYRTLPEYPGYRIGDDGTVWSCRTRKGVGKNGKGSGFVFSDTWKMLSPAVHCGKYLHVVLTTQAGIESTQTVHKLVLLAFIGPCPEGMECRHLDGVGNNNRLSNLAWGTHAENEADRKHHGTDNQGERHGMSKLTADKVREIRTLYAAGGESYYSLGTKFGVTYSTIHEAITRKTWKHVT